MDTDCISILRIHHAISIRLLAEFIAYRTVLLCYWMNILLLGTMLYSSWRYAGHAGLLAAEVTYEVSCAVERRIVVAQALYAAGAACCFINNYISIAIIVLVQLNFAIALRLPLLSEI